MTVVKFVASVFQNVTRPGDTANGPLCPNVGLRQPDIHNLKRTAQGRTIGQVMPRLGPVECHGQVIQTPIAPVAAAVRTQARRHINGHGGRVHHALDFIMLYRGQRVFD